MNGYLLMPLRGLVWRRLCTRRCHGRSRLCDGQGSDQEESGCLALENLYMVTNQLRLYEPGQVGMTKGSQKGGRLPLAASGQTRP